VVLVEKVKGALRLAGADPCALALGLTPGMTLADARARLPEVHAVPYDPAADAALTARVLEDFGRFSPMAALDPPHGLVLDVTGCAHLFGGEDGLLRAVRTRAGRLGLQMRAGLARTPQTARALARFGPGGIAAPGQDRVTARRLPVEALEAGPAGTQALRRAGLTSVGAVDDRPRPALAARFGADFPTRLDRLLGLEDVRITPVRPPAPIVVDRVLAEPVTDGAAVQAVTDDLLVEAMARLEARLQGGRAFRLGVFRVDGEVRRIAVGTARPSRDARAVSRLFRERLAALSRPLDPGFGLDHFRMEVVEVQDLAPVQPAFDAAPNADLAQAEALDALIDRLGARLGPGAVLRVRPVASHLPERACRLDPACRGGSGDDWPARDPGEPPLRPLHLFDRPQPIEAIALAPDGPPARFRWRRVTHQVTRAEGPERIEGEWWRRPGRPARDYYRVEDADGRRFWLFRAGRFGEEPAPRWYVHGLFP